jgi:hypothetical protein
MPRLSALLIGLLISANIYAVDLPKTGGDRPTVKVTVEGHGDTLESAKKNAFRLAVEQAVGVVNVSDQEVSGDRLTKDVIGNYSAGYVRGYKILESHQFDNGRYAVTMTVDVASSKIAERMMSRGETSEIVDGDQAQAQLETQIEQRQRGDQLISQVLSSYPQNAYVVNNGNAEFKISNNRNRFVEIPFELEMSGQWLEALDETLRTVARDDKSCNLLTMVSMDVLKTSRTNGNQVKQLANNVCGAAPDMRVFYKRPGDYFPKSYSYYFNDLTTLNEINSVLQPGLGAQRIGLRVDLLDAGGNVVDTRCADVNTEAFIKYNDPNTGVINLNNERYNRRPDIVGQNKIRGVLNVDLARPSVLGEVAKIKLNVQNTCT